MNYLTCPKCTGPLSSVVDSRPIDDLNGFRAIKRMRVCDSCGEKSQTVEVPKQVLTGILRAMAQSVADGFMEKFK